MSVPKSPAPLAIDAHTAPLRTKPSVYPEPFRSRMAGREKRPLGDLFGLKNFGVNLTRIAPGGESALLHRHSEWSDSDGSYPNRRPGPLASLKVCGATTTR